MGVKSAAKCCAESNFKRACQHVSLFVALMLYTIVGALIFRSFEHTADLEKNSYFKENLLTRRAHFIKTVANITEERYISIALLEYEKIIQTSIKNGILIFEDLERNQWTILQAIFFSSSVLTTIGYGNIVPSTTEGKAFCIVYALIGIPLTLTVIADMGKIFATPVTIFVKKLPPPPPKLRSIILERRTSFYMLLSVCFLFVYLAVGAGLFVIWEEEWTFFDGFYFCFITMTTIGFGDIVPKKPKYMLFSTLYILVGLAVTSTIIELVRRQYAQSWRQLRALRGPLAENFRRLANTPGVDVFTLLTHQDFMKVLAVVPVGRLSYRRSRKEKKWKDVLEAVIKQIALEKSETEKFSTKIVIFESSL